MKDKYKLKEVYVVSVNGIPLGDSHTSLLGACKSCGVSYNVATKDQRAVMKFIVDDNFVSICKTSIVRQNKGQNGNGNNFDKK